MKSLDVTKMRLTRTAQSERESAESESVHVGAVVGESLISFGVASITSPASTGIHNTASASDVPPLGGLK